jgi:hypothetical protein
MVQVSFPQEADQPDAVLFGFQSGFGRSGIANGLGFSVDFTVPDLEVQPGKALIDRGDGTTKHPDIQPPITVSDTLIAVEINTQTVSLASNDLNHIFLDANVGTDDAAQVVTNTTGSRPTTASVKIGEVDTATTEISEGWNRLTDSAGLSFPDQEAADKQSSLLREGTVVYVRDTDTHFFVT